METQPPRNTREQRGSRTNCFDCCILTLDAESQEQDAPAQAAGDRQRRMFPFSVTTQEYTQSRLKLAKDKDKGP